MKASFARSFQKSYSKLPLKVKQRFAVRLEIFIKNQFDRALENHPLKGNLLGFRSISITGDYRAKFVVLDKETVEFVDIGRHPKVYGT